MNRIQKILDRALAADGGILRLEPAWVARDFLPPGRRLGLPDDQYQLGPRGGICERWLASTTRADNRIGVPDEGLSFLALDSGKRVTLKQAVESAGDLLLGKEYADRYGCLGRLAKIFDYGDRLPLHIHQMQRHAGLVGRKSKEEAYYFPEDVPMGPHPETFFGVHPYIAEQKRYDILLPHLTDWRDESILRHSRAYLQMPNDGFHVPAGVLHAPGSALTIELQEDSDVFAMLQAKVGDRPIDRDLLFKDVRKEDREKLGERALLDMIDWEVNGDPYFYENRHTPPVPLPAQNPKIAEEFWIFYNTRLFSGKKLVVHPGGVHTGTERGVYSVLVWRGEGTFGGLGVEGWNPALDELLVVHSRACVPLEIRNTGSIDLVIFKFFGPDINPDAPVLKKR
ncbi:hypothetical protein JW906_01175 [bacterium]|nr:hypothetical protein [bacterium]